MSGPSVPVARVVAVVAELPDGRQQVGTGYLVAPRLVVTAQHCTVDKRTGAPVRALTAVRATDGRTVDAAVTAAAPHLDVAVLTLAEPLADPGTAPPRYGRVDRAQAAELPDCVALGYPLFQLDPTDRTRALAEVHGVIRVTEDAETGHLVLRDPLLATVGPPPVSVPEGDRQPGSPWGGLSGAVVFSGDLALGVIVEHHPRQGASALRLIPFDRLLGTTAGDALGVGAALVDVGADAGRPVGPTTLVAPPVVLAGRTDERARLRALADAAAPGHPAVVVVLSGMGGAGKSALARAVAADVADRFPDARLEVGLHGYTPGRDPRDPSEVLGELLVLVGTPAADIPGTAEARAAAWRAWLSTRRVLLVLDNARDAEQVRPLLPGPGGSGAALVLITGRRRLDGVDTTDTVEVAPLAEADAVALLAGGRSPGAGTDADLAALARTCGYLPLALRSIGSLLTDLSPAELIEVMTSASHPFEHLAEVDHATAAAFTVSYEALTDELQHLLRACAWHPGPDFDAASVAALTGRARPLVTVQLVELVRTSMLTEPTDRRYTFHDVYLGHARRQAAASDDAETVIAARARLYADLQARLDIAAGLVWTDNRHAIAPPPDQRAFAARSQAQAWLTAASAELSTCAHAALADGWPGADRFAETLAYWLHAGGRSDAGANLYRALADAAAAAGDDAGEAAALAGFGLVAYASSRPREARDAYRRSADLFAHIGDDRGRADAAKGLGDIARLHGEHDEALAAYREAHDRYERAGDRRGQVDALEGMGEVADQRGDAEGARAAFQRAHDLADEIGYRSGTADSLCGLAALAQAGGDLEAAEGTYRRAHDIYDEIGNRHGLAYALLGLGDVARRRDDRDGARTAYAHALDLYRELGFPHCQADVLAGQADVAFADGDLDGAGDHYRQAQALAEEIGYRAGQARALHGLAALAEARDDPAAAAELHAEARAADPIPPRLTGRSARDLRPD